MNLEEITITHKKSLKQRLADFFANPKKRLIFIICSGLVLIAAVATGLYFMTKTTPQEQAEEDALIEEKNYEPTFYSRLDGSAISSETQDKYPLAVMVENHVDARPQAGLDKASIVYEAIAEGGITRFMAIFGPKEADKVGPVRSARPYYVDWAMGYNAYYAHVGGNAYALDQIANEKVFDLDQFKYTAPYWRDTSLKVSREHTMFASVSKLREQASKLGYSATPNYRQYKFAEAINPNQEVEDSSNNANTQTVTDSQSQGQTTPSSSTPSATNINVLFSSASYNVKFKYDNTTNTYKRVLNNGSVQKDRESKSEIAPTNLIVMTVKRSPLVTRINEHGYLMETVGEGSAKIFLDGEVIEGKWKKDSRKDREVFYDSKGEEIVFNRGQFWICVIPPDSSVNYE
ncbi:MAG: putative lipoprotein YerB precursor [bacterium ADurb.Bin212]|nr:MAG: putative lipoprotein YerB precursor [bacterium ADurb.Bin212]